MACARSSSASACSMSSHSPQPSRLRTTRPAAVSRWHLLACGARARGSGPGWQATLDVAFTWVAMNSTVFGGTSPTAVTWWPSTTVENADEEPTRAGPSAGLVSGLRGSTNTDTEATPSVNTRCATGSLEPGIACEGARGHAEAGRQSHGLPQRRRGVAGRAADRRATSGSWRHPPAA